MENLCENNEHNFSVKFFNAPHNKIKRPHVSNNQSNHSFVISFRAVFALVPTFLSGIFH